MQGKPKRQTRTLHDTAVVLKTNDFTNKHIVLHHSVLFIILCCCTHVFVFTWLLVGLFDLFCFVSHVEGGVDPGNCFVTCRDMRVCMCVCVQAFW